MAVLSPPFLLPHPQIKCYISHIMKTNKITGSQAIWHSLINAGVDLVFGYPGGTIMPAYDALYDFNDKIHHVLVRHEQGAAHAAEGYARVTGRAGVCIVTSGPGATNLVTGIADAMLDSVPIVCITGQVGRNYLGTDAFQETDMMSITMPITKWNYQVTEAGEIPLAIAKAFFIAQNGRPGPVLIDITKDAQLNTFEYKPVHVSEIENFVPRPTPETSALEAAADLINESKQPLIFVGHGILISKAEKEVLQLAETADIPLASTLLGLSAISPEHPKYVGMLGMHGNYGPNVLTNEADLIIAIGMRFDDRVTGDLKKYATQAKVIHIDIDHAEINKNLVSTVSIVADAKDALSALMPLIKANKHKEWFARFDNCAKEELDKVITRDTHPQSGKIRMAEVLAQLSDLTKGQAVIVSDVGQNQMMAARYYKFKKPNSWVSSGGLGTMGFGLPAAIGAKFGAADRDVVTIIGDGGIQMTVQELGTILQEKLNLKIIILANKFLGMVRQWQELFFDSRYSFTNLVNPDFIKLAEAYSIPAKKIENRENIKEALETMLSHNGAYLLEFVCEKEENVFPFVPAGAAVNSIRLE